MSGRIATACKYILVAKMNKGGLSISEKANEYSVMTYILDSKSFAITGGKFGIEASVIALIGYIGVTLIAFVMIKRKT